MSVTLRELFQPTIVENYPDGPGPLKGAVFQDRYRGVHVLQRDENGLEKCVACFLCAAACPSNCIYIEAAENTEEQRVSAAPNATPRSITSTTTAASSADIASRRVRRTPSLTAMALRSPRFNASNLVYRKEQMLAPAGRIWAPMPNSAAGVRNWG